MSEWKEAGTGDNHLYLLVPPNQGSPEPLTREKHYIGVDSACWFINKKSNWFRSRTASGTFQISLADGREEYNVALGTFELDNGARTAPVFDKPVLPDRRYQGGVLAFRVSLTALNRDTALTTVLKSAANASLSIVGGMVETATMAGPQQILGAAGGALVKGIADTLSNSAPGREPLFSGEGIEAAVRSEAFRFPEMYLLFHRGSQLDASKLKTARYGAVRVATYDGAALVDGAWLLLRLRRSERYSGVRQWFDEDRKLRGALRDLVTDVTLGTRTRADALAQFSGGDGGGSSLYDQFVAIRRAIREDGVLTRGDANDRVDGLSKAFADARTKIAAHPASTGPGPASADVGDGERALPMPLESLVDEGVWQNREVAITVIEPRLGLEGDGEAPPE